MRWVRFEGAGGIGCGVVAGDRIRVAPHASLPEVVAADALRTLGADVLREPATELAITDVRLLSPLPAPPSIRDFMAFEQHVEGMGRLVGAAPPVPDVWYEQPLYYFGNPAAVIGPHDDVPIPPGCTVFDFELEVAAIIGPLPDGRPLADLTIADAARCIAGYTLLNDWSARDLQAREMQGPLGPCKGKDSTTTLGPWLLTADELPDLAHGSCDVVLRVEVGDRFVGSDRLDSMSWTFAEMIAYASRGTRLHAGDVIGSGTCGDGCLAERWGRAGREGAPPLRPGEVVRMSGGPLGTIANRVVAGSAVVSPLLRRVPRYGS